MVSWTFTNYISNCLYISPLFPHGTSSPSLHLLIFTCTGGRSAFFHRFCVYFMVGPLLSSVGPYWIHLFIYGFMNVSNSVVYFSGRSSWGHAWTDIYFHRSSVHTKIWCIVLNFHCMCICCILGVNQSPYWCLSGFMSSIVACIPRQNMVWIPLSVFAVSQETVLLCRVLCLLLIFLCVIWYVLCVPFPAASCFASPTIYFIPSLFVLLCYIYCVSSSPLFRYNAEFDCHSHA